MRRRAKVDANHGEVMDALRKSGHLVLSLAAVGSGCPDILAYRADRGFRLIEVKGPKGTLTPDQSEFMGKGWPVTVARTAEDAIG